jgi:hypothetical protein
MACSVGHFEHGGFTNSTPSSGTTIAVMQTGESFILLLLQLFKIYSYPKGIGSEGSFEAN